MQFIKIEVTEIQPNTNYIYRTISGPSLGRLLQFGENKYLGDNMSVIPISDVIEIYKVEQE